jgi:hypothetical protein
MLGRLFRILTTYDPAPLEIALGCLTLGWGLWLLCPWQPPSFAVGAAFRDLRATGVPEEVWGAVAATLGVLRLRAVAYDWRLARSLFSLAATGFWGTVTASIVHNTFTGTGTPFYGVVTLACFVVFVRLWSARG